MTVESNYVIAIAKRLAPRFSTNEKQNDQNQNQSHNVRVIFPALRASYRWLLRIEIGSLFLL